MSTPFRWGLKLLPPFNLGCILGITVSYKGELEFASQKWIRGMVESQLSECYLLLHNPHVKGWN